MHTLGWVGGTFWYLTATSEVRLYRLVVTSVKLIYGFLRRLAYEYNTAGKYPSKYLGYSNEDASTNPSRNGSVSMAELESNSSQKLNSTGSTASDWFEDAHCLRFTLILANKIRNRIGHSEPGFAVI